MIHLNMIPHAKPQSRKELYFKLKKRLAPLRLCVRP